MLWGRGRVVKNTLKVVKTFFFVKKHVFIIFEDFNNILHEEKIKNILKIFLDKLSGYLEAIESY